MSLYLTKVFNFSITPPLKTAECPVFERGKVKVLSVTNVEQTSGSEADKKLQHSEGAGAWRIRNCLQSIQ